MQTATIELGQTGLTELALCLFDDTVAGVGDVQGIGAIDGCRPVAFETTVRTQHQAPNNPVAEPFAGGYCFECEFS